MELAFDVSLLCLACKLSGRNRRATWFCSLLRKSADVTAVYYVLVVSKASSRTLS